MYVYMSVTLQEGNYALPYVSICCRLPKGLKYTAVACCFYSVSANSVIASREPTSRAPCSDGLSTVPNMDCAAQSRELPLERFASTTAMAMVHFGFVSFGL